MRTILLLLLVSVGPEFGMSLAGLPSVVGAGTAGGSSASFSPSCTPPWGLSTRPVLWAGWASSQHGGSELQRPVSRENHAEATLHFGTQLNIQNTAAASSSLPRFKERKYGRSASPWEEHQCPTLRLSGMENMAVAPSGKCNLSQIEKANLSAVTAKRSAPHAPVSSFVRESRYQLCAKGGGCRQGQAP